MSPEWFEVTLPIETIGVHLSEFPVPHLQLRSWAGCILLFCMIRFKLAVNTLTLHKVVRNDGGRQGKGKQRTSLSC